MEEVKGSNPFRSTKSPLLFVPIPRYDDRKIMSTAVSLKSIVDALQGVSDEYPSFLDLDSGEVITVSSEMLSAAEESEEGEEPDLLDWERDLYEAAKRVVHAERCLALPTQFDIHEWEIMADFVDSLEPGRIILAKPFSSADLTGALKAALAH